MGPSTDPRGTPWLMIFASSWARIHSPLRQMGPICSHLSTSSLSSATSPIRSSTSRGWHLCHPSIAATGSDTTCNQRPEHLYFWAGTWSGLPQCFWQEPSAWWRPCLGLLPGRQPVGRKVSWVGMDTLPALPQQLLLHAKSWLTFHVPQGLPFYDREVWSLLCPSLVSLPCEGCQVLVVPLRRLDVGSPLHAVIPHSSAKHVCRMIISVSDHSNYIVNMVSNYVVSISNNGRGRVQLSLIYVQCINRKWNWL